MDEYLRDFVQESDENIRELNTALLDLEDDPDDEEAMDRVFRTAHTLKGNCGAMGFEDAESLAHALEDRLDDVRAGRLEVTPELMDAIFAGVDELEAMLDEVRDEGEPQRDPSETVRELRSMGPEEVIEQPTDDELEAAVSAASDPTDPEHNVYHVRLDVDPGDGVNNAALVVEALEDAFDLLGTRPPREEIEGGQDGPFDAVFGSAVGEASIEGALDPVDQVTDAIITDVSDRAETAGVDDAASTGDGVPDVDELTDVSSDEADDMEVDDLLDEFDAYDDLDDMVEKVEDTDDLGELGDAGTFDDVDVDVGVDVPDPLEETDETAEPEATDTAAEADSGTDQAETADAGTADASAGETDTGAAGADDTEEVEDASETFQELKEEVDPVGFDELQDELDELEFDQYDQEDEVGFDELLDEEELEDDSFDPFGAEGDVEEAVDDMLVEDEGTGETTAGFTAGDEPTDAEPADTGEAEPEPETPEEPASADEPAAAEGATADEGAEAGSGAGIGDFALDDEDVDFDEEADIEADDAFGDDESFAEEGDAFADDVFGTGDEAEEPAAEAEAAPEAESDVEADVEPEVEAEASADPSVQPADPADVEPAIEPATADTEAGASEPAADADADTAVEAPDEPASPDVEAEGPAAGDDVAAEGPTAEADAGDSEPATAGADTPATPETPGGDEAATDTAEASGDAADTAEAGGDSFDTGVEADAGFDTEADTGFEAGADAGMDFGSDEEVEFGDEDMDFETADDTAVGAADDEPATASADEGFGSFDDDVGGEFSEDFEEDISPEAPDTSFDDTAEVGDDIGEFGDESLSEITFDERETPADDTEATGDAADATASADDTADAAETGTETPASPATGEEDIEGVEVEEFSADEAEADLGVDDAIGTDLGDTEDIASELAEAEMAADSDTDRSLDDLTLGDDTAATGDLGPGGSTTDRPDASVGPSPTERVGVDREQLPDRDVDLDELLPKPPYQVAREAAEESDDVQSVRVDIDQVDRLLNLVEGLVTNRARLRRAVESGESLADIDREIDDLEELTNELQETVMDVRLVPLRKTASRIPRTVRDIARDQGKEVDFRMEGEDVEIDRSVLDDIGDPLTHLVRNAVDHGIEPPEEREAAGKDPEGTVELRAERRRDDVVIEIEDDGRGLDPDRLREEAVEEDVLDPDEAEELSDEEAYDLIFHPGFSTASEVTDVSGRGVGMDVVKSTVDELDGTVEVESELGEGTTVRMVLPVTVAIADVLFVEAGDEEFGVPLKTVEEIGRMAEVERIEDGEAIQYGDREQELVRLADALSAPGTSREDGGMLLHLREGVRDAALHSDAVRGQQEVVVRPFEDLLGEIPGLSGAAILGEGEVVTILDVNSL